MCTPVSLKSENMHQTLHLRRLITLSHAAAYSHRCADSHYKNMPLFMDLLLMGTWEVSTFLLLLIHRATQYTCLLVNMRVVLLGHRIRLCSALDAPKLRAQAA